MKLQLYVLRQLGTAFLFAVAGVLFIALPGIAVTTVHKMPLADASVLMRYVPLVLENLAPYVLPICFLLAVVATYGRLASDREWTAIQMAGVQPLKMLLPALGMALVLGAGTYWMVTQELPKAKSRQRAALVQAAASSLQNLQPGRTTLNFQGFFLRANWRDLNDQSVLHEVLIRRPDEEGNSRIDVFAKKAHIRSVDGELRVDLYDWTWLSTEEGLDGWSDHGFIRYPLDSLVESEERGDNRPKYMTNTQIREELAGLAAREDVEVSQAEGEEEAGTHPGPMPLAALVVQGEPDMATGADAGQPDAGDGKAEQGTEATNEIAEAEESEEAKAPEGPTEEMIQDRLRKLRFQLHHRTAMSTAFLLFLGLGAPTGLLLRRGTQLGALSVAVGFGLVYYVLSMRVGKELGRGGAVPPWVGAWITPLLFSVASVILLRKAMRR